MSKRFDLGRVVATSGVHNAMEEHSYFKEFVMESFLRYCCGDWGDTDPDDAQRNNESAENGERVLAAYTNDKYKIWIITERDRSCTTIRFPDEY